MPHAHQIQYTHTATGYAMIEAETEAEARAIFETIPGQRITEGAVKYEFTEIVAVEPMICTEDEIEFRACDEAGCTVAATAFRVGDSSFVPTVCDDHARMSWGFVPA